MFITYSITNFLWDLNIIKIDLNGGRGLILAHDLLWSIGLTFLTITVGYTLGLYDETGDKQKFKIPKDVIVIFSAGLIMFITSYYMPIPIIHQ